MTETSLLESDHKFWAFALDTRQRERRTRFHQPAPQRHLERYAIMACSPTARAAGVTAGMPLLQARRLAPGLRVIVCNR